MNSTSENEQTPRPFGYWLKAVDRLMAAEFATAFESFGVTRRDWRLLNRVDGTVDGGTGSIPVHKLGRLIELGWVTDADDTWTLTGEGRDAKERLGTIVDGIRAKVTDAVPADDLATTIATLEQLARAFGWDENTPLPQGRRHRHVSGHGFGRGFESHGSGRGHGHGFGPRRFGRHGFGPRGFEHGEHEHGGFEHGGFEHGGFERGEHARGHAGHGAPGFGGRVFGERGDCRHDEHPFAHGEGRGRHAHHQHGHHGRARFARMAQGAYERGFDAGFSRGRGES